MLRQLQIDYVDSDDHHGGTEGA